MSNILTKTLRSSFLILAFSLFLNTTASAQNCATPPTCETLGYTQTAADCGSNTKALKCPLDQSKMFCIFEACEVGSILYSDKSCSKMVTSGKTPIGVVFSSEKRLAVALTEKTTTRLPGGKSGDITELNDCIDIATAHLCYQDGKENTRKIVAQYGNSDDYAAGYCANYITIGTNNGDWYLPSIRDLKLLYSAKSWVNTTLGLLGKSAIESTSYWSSVKKDKYYSWAVLMHGGGSLSSSGNLRVRAVITF